MLSFAQLVGFGAGAVVVGGVSYIVYNRFRTLAKPQIGDVAFVQKSIASSKVLVLSKTYCPYCKAAKKLLLEDLKAQDVTFIELDQREDGERLQAAG